MDSGSRVGEKFGEIEIGGERWGWTAIGRMEEAGGSRTLREVRWSVSFRHPEQANRGFWCDLPERHAARLSERRLRQLFEEARSTGPPTSGGGEIRRLGRP